MLHAVVFWLDQLSSSVFWACATGLLLIDGVAAVVLVQTRSRELVNQWTSRVLAANLLLLGAGLGVPAAAYTLKLAANALLPSVSASATSASAPKSAGVESAAPAAAP